MIVVRRAEGRWTTEIAGIRPILETEAPVEELRDTLAEALRETGMLRLEDLADEVEWADDADELNGMLEELYDWGDDNGVWIG